MEKEKCFKAVVGQVKPDIKISMSSREAVTRDLRIFVSAGTINERKEIRRCRTATFRHDRPCCMNGTKAFTLIELLVVVLIIGILAAVAVPQYQLAVNKSRFSNLRLVAQTYVKASEAYYLANGVYPGSFEELAVDFPAQSTTAISGYTCATASDMYCCMVPDLTNFSEPKVTCALTNNAFVYLYNKQRNMEFCRAKNTDPQAIKLCKAIGTLSNRNQGIETPTGVLSGYDTYTISR